MSKENIANNSFMEVNTIWGLTSIVFYEYSDSHEKLLTNWEVGDQVDGEP